MFFRRMFAPKFDGTKMQGCCDDDKINLRNKQNGNCYDAAAVVPSPTSQPGQQEPQQNHNQPLIRYATPQCSVFQLTPLWEYILRKRKLPENVCPVKMFDEFLERFRDPEWQVRQHALRVFVDVLDVVGPKADAHMTGIVPQLVENLGHPAPTVRKGALDCLRIYLSNTAMPETILLQILDIGFNQRNKNETFGGGRLTCGVMLSLPALIQSTLHTTKRNFILRATIDMMAEKMKQLMHQEITLKVLSKLRDLIGIKEFTEFLTPCAYREFDILCNVYGIENSSSLRTDASRAKSWRFPSAELCSTKQSDSLWQSSSDEEYRKLENCEKVIMETEIKINENTLTMRILEAKDDCSDSTVVEIQNPNIPMESSFEDDPSINSKSAGIVKVLSDSECDEINENLKESQQQLTLPSTPRTPKRVTFGGEIVKMRTPDSDTITPPIELESDDPDKSANIKDETNKTNPLTIDIPNDNAKPASEHNKVPDSSAKRKESLSPFKRINVSPVDSIISPKEKHKEIEVLHNLQRDPSPARLKRFNSQEEIADNEKFGNRQETINNVVEEGRQKKTRSWEELAIVSNETLVNLRCADWRQRSNGFCDLEGALQSTDNLARIQPFLESLLRTLLSSERHSEVAEDKRRILSNLISRLPLDNLEDRTGQILTGLCRQGGAGSNRICKTLMQRLPPAAILLKLISEDFLHAKSSRFRENALHMVMYALMTFPSTCFDTATCIGNATFAALDRKKRVRHAALDVLAILGQVTSPRNVMDTVQSIVMKKDNGNSLLIAAVKARLSRKQLPIVSSDGTVQCVLRLPSPPQTQNTITTQNGISSSFGPDIEWINAGIGSVSPTSLKRRKSQKYGRCAVPMYDAGNYYQQIGDSGARYEYRRQLPHEPLTFNGEVKETNGNGDVGVHHSSTGTKLQEENPTNNFQYKLPTRFVTGVRKCGGDLVYLNGRRLGIKSCSDSSMDGRSSDSTYTSSSSGGCGGTTSTTEITGHINRQSINSRFPTMERIDLTGIYSKRQSPQMLQNHCPVMGNDKKLDCSYMQYQQFQNRNCHLNATYPKVNYSMNSFKKYENYKNQQPQHNVSSSSQRYHQETQETFHTESRFNENCGELNGNTYTRNCNGNGSSLGTNQLTNGECNSRRFVNVEKFKAQSTKFSPTIPSLELNSSRATTTGSSKISFPVKCESLSRQDSSNGLRDSLGDEEILQITPETEKAASVHDTEEVKVQPIEPNENVITPASPPKEVENIENDSKDAKAEPSPVTSKDESSIRSPSAQSKTESIKTLLEDSTPLSRSQSIQSAKSFIEEELEGGGVENSLTVDNISDSVPTRDVDQADSIAQVNNNSISSEVCNGVENCDPTAFLPRTHSPTIEEIKNKSRNSPETIIFAEIPLDNTTETSSLSSNQTNNYAGGDCIPKYYKTKSSPLHQKAKVTTYLRKNCRISPVKQIIKMPKPELFPQTLTPFEKPRDALHKACDQLDSLNWETLVAAIKSMVRLMRYHADTMDPQMHLVCIQLTKSVRNLRSQVSRAACQASTELFTIKSKFIEQECDDLVSALLHRSADTNRFLRADANRALESMCDNLNPIKVLNLLTGRGAQHQNALVRTQTAKLLNRLADRLGCDKIFTMNRDNRDKFIITGANLLLEGSLETRSYAKSLFRLLSDHHNYKKALLDVIPLRIYRNIEKTLKNIR